MLATTQEFGPFDLVKVGGVSQEVWTKGAGSPLLFLHPGIGLRGAFPFLDALANSHRVIAPIHPGFGRSELPDWMNSVDDLSYVYMDLLKELDLDNVVVVGSSLGGWIATALAVKSTARLSHLILLDSVGMKFGSEKEREIADIFSLGATELDRRLYHRPSPDLRNYTSLTDEALSIIVRNKETEALFGWAPYMHDPKLRRRAHRIDIPCLVLWGKSDGIVTPDYGKAFAKAIPGARFSLISEAGHLPHIEQPMIAADEIAKFAPANSRSAAA
jgi:pimeloyl-ACP methyl ester carboxylesterase